MPRRSTVQWRCIPGREMPSTSAVRSRLIPVMYPSCGWEMDCSSPTQTPPTLRSSEVHQPATCRYTHTHVSNHDLQFIKMNVRTCTHSHSMCTHTHTRITLVSSTFHEHRLEVKGFSFSSKIWWIIQQQESSQQQIKIGYSNGQTKRSPSVGLTHTFVHLFWYTALHIFAFFPSSR